MEDPELEKIKQKQLEELIQQKNLKHFRKKLVI